MVDPPEYLNTKQLARLLGVTPNMLEKHQSARLGFPVRKGRVPRGLPLADDQDDLGECTRGGSVMKAVLTDEDYDIALLHTDPILCSICYEPIETTPWYKRMGNNAGPGEPRPLLRRLRPRDRLARARRPERQRVCLRLAFSRSPTHGTGNPLRPDLVLARLAATPGALEAAGGALISVFFPNHLLARANPRCTIKLHPTTASEQAPP